MSWTASDRRQLDDFRDWLVELFGGEERFITVQEESSEEDESFSVLLESGDRAWYEVAIPPQGDGVRIGFATQNRPLNESIEQGILDTGDSPSEFLDDRMSDVVELEEPPEMDHFFDTAFRFTTTIPIASLTELGTEAIREQVQQLVEGYYAAFQEFVDKV